MAEASITIYLTIRETTRPLFYPFKQKSPLKLKTDHWPEVSASAVSLGRLPNLAGFSQLALL